VNDALVPFKPREIIAQPLDVERLIARWTEGRSPQTVRAYSNDLRQFAVWAGRPSAGEAMAWILGASHGEANEIAHQYKSAMVDSGLASNTVNRRLAALRSIVSLGQRFGMIPWSLSVDGMKVEALRDVAGPGTDALATALRKAGAHPSAAKAARDTAIIRVIHDLALRRAELSRLLVSDLDVKQGKLRVLGKGKREKIPRTLPPRTMAALKAWLKQRSKQPAHALPDLFLNFHRGQQKGLAGNGLYYVFTTEYGLKPHGVRHTSITVGYQQTKDPHKVMQHARHSSIDMTMHYVDAQVDAGGEVARIVSETLS
jgi:integrase/recombinase XerC